MRRAAALVAALLALAVAAPSAQAGHRHKWDTQVFARIPKPGFPARAYVAPNHRVYEGTYVNPAGDNQRSRVLEYTSFGELLRSWTVHGQDLSGDHGVQVATSDSRGRLVLLDHTPARALLLNINTGKFSRYSTFEDLAPCPPAQTGPHCSPTQTDHPPVANYAAWGRHGELYVTDYQQAVIWRVPPGGGKAHVWLADPRLDGDEFGTTGIVRVNRHRLLVDQQSSAGGGDGDPTTGKLYSLKIRPSGQPGHMRRLWESQPLDGPDGFWVARSRHVYIALAGSNQLVELGRRGTEIDRFPTAPGVGENGSSVPFDTPSSVMFLGQRLMVANQSFPAGNSDDQAILDVFAGEPGMPERIPRCAGVGRCG